MRVVVFGSRCFDPSQYKDISWFMERITQSLDERPETDDEETLIISGKARGADRMGEKYAELWNLELLEFPADWDGLGKSAGYIRNTEMAKEADFGIGFWDGRSKGTAHMMGELKRLGKPYDMYVKHTHPTSFVKVRNPSRF